MTRRPRVAIDGRLALMGGPGRYVVTLVEALVRDGDWDVDVLATPTVSARLSEVLHGSAQLVPVRSRPFSLREQWELPRVVERLGVDVFHAPYLNWPWMMRTPVVVTIHDLVWFQREFVSAWWPATVYARTMLTGAVHRAHAVVCVSKTIAAEVAARFAPPDTRLHVAQNAIGPGFRALLSRPVRVAREPDEILYVGTFKRWKRVDLLLDAVSLLRRRGRTVRLVLAGTPARHNSLDVPRAASRRGLQEVVTVTGPTSDEKLADLYARCAAYVMPSAYEGFGFTTLEALTAGCPVVAADMPIHREVAGEAAVYYAQGDAASLADALAGLLDSPNTRAELAQLGPTRAAGFSPGRMAAATIEAYRAATGHLA